MAMLMGKGIEMETTMFGAAFFSTRPTLSSQHGFELTVGRQVTRMGGRHCGSVMASGRRYTQVCQNDASHHRQKKGSLGESPWMDFSNVVKMAQFFHRCFKRSDCCCCHCEFSAVSSSLILHTHYLPVILP